MVANCGKNKEVSDVLECFELHASSVLDDLHVLNQSTHTLTNKTNMFVLYIDKFCFHFKTYDVIYKCINTLIDQSGGVSIIFEIAVWAS